MRMSKLWTAGLALAGLSFGAFALTGGPFQVEFSSFEPADASDAVNLHNGDFVYTIPLADVASPSGMAYPIVLSYHGGIQNEQDASWVGLGWSLSVGSLNRIVRGFADDYNGEESFSDYLASGTGSADMVNIFGGGAIGGLQSPWSGSGGLSLGKRYSNGTSSWLFSNFSEVSWYGIGVGYRINFDDGALNSGSVYTSGSIMGFLRYEAGVDLASGSGPSYYANASANAGVIGGFSFDTRGNSHSFAGVGMASANGTTKDGANYSDKTTSYAISDWINLATCTYPWPGGFSYTHVDMNWSYEKMTSGKAYGYLYQSPYSPAKVQTYDNILTQVMQNAPTWKYEAAETPIAGIGENTRTDVDRLEAIRVGDYNLASQDVYNVAAQGILGTFMPYSYNANVTCRSTDDTKDGIMRMAITPPPTDPNAEKYQYFDGGQLVFSPEYKNGFEFKMVGEPSLNLIDNTTETYDGSPNYSNIDNSPTGPNSVTGTKIEPIFGVDKQLYDKLTGFVVTDQQGKKYYFTFPLFSLQNVLYINQTPNVPPQIDNTQNCYYREDFGAYATTWLLTAITGPDYVKKTLVKPQSGQTATWDPDLVSENLLPHSGDYGYWAAFRYQYGAPIVENQKSMPTLDPNGTRLDKASYAWRAPFWNNDYATNQKYAPNPTQRPHYVDPCNTSAYKYESEFGLREITFLKSIETASQVAYFRTSERLDGFGLDFATEYPTFHDKYPIDKADVDQPIDQSVSSNHYDFCTYSEISKWPKIIPWATDISTKDQCFKVKVKGYNDLCKIFGTILKEPKWGHLACPQPPIMTVIG